MYKQARRVLATVTAILLLFSGNVVARAEEQNPPQTQQQSQLETKSQPGFYTHNPNTLAG